MSWLRKRAEEAAKEYHRPEDPDAVEDKIERVARAFAERAASEAYRRGIDEGESSASAYEHGYKYTPTDEKEVIQDTLEAADKDES